MMQCVSHGSIGRGGGVGCGPAASRATPSCSRKPGGGAALPPSATTSVKTARSPGFSLNTDSRSTSGALATIKRALLSRTTCSSSRPRYARLIGTQAAPSSLMASATRSASAPLGSRTKHGLALLHAQGLQAGRGATHVGACLCIGPQRAVGQAREHGLRRVARPALEQHRRYAVVAWRHAAVERRFSRCGHGRPPVDVAAGMCGRGSEAPTMVFVLCRQTTRRRYNHGMPKADASRPKPSAGALRRALTAPADAAHPTLAQRIADDLGVAIVDGALADGARIREEEIAHHYNAGGHPEP